MERVLLDWEDELIRFYEDDNIIMLADRRFLKLLAGGYYRIHREWYWEDDACIRME